MAKARIEGEPTYALELSRIEAQAIADLVADVSFGTEHGKAAGRVSDALGGAGIFYRDSTSYDGGGPIGVITIQDDV